MPTTAAQEAAPAIGCLPVWFFAFCGHADGASHNQKQPREKQYAGKSINILTYVLGSFIMKREVKSHNHAESLLNGSRPRALWRGVSSLQTSSRFLLSTQTALC
jgi:hypothetical protein